MVNLTHSEDSFSRNQHDNTTRSRSSDDIFTTTQNSNTTRSKQSSETSYTLTDTNITKSDTTSDTDEPDFKKMSGRLVSKGLFGRNRERNDESEEQGDKSNRDSNIVIYNSSLKEKKVLDAHDDTIMSLVILNSVLYASSSSKFFRYNSEKEIWKITEVVEKRILNIYQCNLKLH
jgi:hypothetical protein